MRRPVLLIALLVLAVAACSGEGASPPSSVTATPTAATVPTPTTRAVTTTSAPLRITTTVTDPITAGTGPVTDHPNLPQAQPRVDALVLPNSGWYWALYSASLADEPFTEGPTLLYLVNAAGDLYEMTSWPADSAPFAIADARPDGLAVALVFYDGDKDVYEVIEWERENGSERLLHTATGDEFFGSSTGVLQYTRPSGQNLVVYRNNGGDEWLERRNFDGELLVEIGRKPYDDWDSALSWIYGRDGTELIVGGDEMLRIRNDGTTLNGIWSPPAESCRPVRWWDGEHVLAACRGDVPTLPHEYYNLLWAIPRRGGVGEPIVEAPAGPVANVYFGYFDATPWSDPVYLDAAGDCGAGWVEYRGGDGIGYRLSGPERDHGLVDVLADGLVLRTWGDCDQSLGDLQLTDRDGNLVQYLIPRIGDAEGVIAVVGD